MVELCLGVLGGEAPDFAVGVALVLQSGCCKCGLEFLDELYVCLGVPRSHHDPRGVGLNAEAFELISLPRCKGASVRVCPLWLVRGSTRRERQLEAPLFLEVNLLVPEILCWDAFSIGLRATRELRFAKAATAVTGPAAE